MQVRLQCAGGVDEMGKIRAPLAWGNESISLLACQAMLSMEKESSPKRGEGEMLLCQIRGQAESSTIANTSSSSPTHDSHPQPPHHQP